MAQRNTVLNEAISLSFQRVLTNHRLTVGAAAKKLGVSRQTFHTYLNGKVPRQKTLNKAVRLWEMKFLVGDQQFDVSDFGGAQAQLQSKDSAPEQLTLWQALDAIRNEDLKIGIRRVGHSLRVSVSIDIPA